MIAIAIHGGAGNILVNTMTTIKQNLYKKGLDQAIEAAYLLLSEGKTAVDAVAKAVECLENNPLFNAGKGSVFNAEGKQEMDAAIMDGKTQQSGAVALVQNIQNPILLAKAVMQKSSHVFLAGKGAVQFAQEQGFELVEDSYFYDEHRYKQWQKLKNTKQTALDHSVHLGDKKMGTVGAVACDKYGNIAAATSTGGTTNKRYGRIGDSPLIGAGTYAHNATCAVSCTGIGEYFIQEVAAYQVAAQIEFAGKSLEAATDYVIHHKMSPIQGSGGLIAINAQGNIAMPFNCNGMFRAFKNEQGSKGVFIGKK